MTFYESLFFEELLNEALMSHIHKTCFQRSERCGFRQCVQNWNNTDLQNYKLDLISYKSGVFTEISEIFITKKAHVFYIWPKLAK